jgi:hypothetical protein
MRPFKFQQQELDEKNIPFYARIGLLSVRFSEIESLINHIIEKLINSDEEMISYLLIERNVLDKNLEILSLINKKRSYEEEKINNIISELRALKETRNFFIHGVWSEIKSNEKGETYIYCADHRWKKEKQIPTHMKGFNTTLSTRYKQTKFALKDFDSKIKKADEISQDLKTIWKVLEEEGENAFI